MADLTPREEACERRARPASMFDFPITTELDRVRAWKMWCEGFSKLEVEPMTLELTQVYLRMMSTEVSAGPVNEKLEEDFSTVFGYSVLTKRSYSLELTIGTFAKAIITLATRNVGSIVMYANYLRFAQIEWKLGMITTQNLADIFPIGFPTMEEIHDHWYRQKDVTYMRPPIVNGSGSNMLDGISGTLLTDWLGQVK